MKTATVVVVVIAHVATDEMASASVVIEGIAETEVNAKTVRRDSLGRKVRNADHAATVTSAIAPRAASRESTNQSMRPHR